MTDTKKENQMSQRELNIRKLASITGGNPYSDAFKDTKQQITDKILKEVLKNKTENGICEFPNSPLTTGKVITAIDIEKAISLTFAECSKRNSDFVKKLKEEIFVKVDWAECQTDTQSPEEYFDNLKEDIKDKIDNLAKQFNFAGGENDNKKTN